LLKYSTSSANTAIFSPAELARGASRGAGQDFRFAFFLISLPRVLLHFIRLQMSPGHPGTAKIRIPDEYGFGG
jgi:hypothetical protein